VGSFVTLFENQVGGEEDFIREIRSGKIRPGKREKPGIGAYQPVPA
jgi:hypothetical protein